MSPSSLELQFAFIDGSLDYACAGCDQNCCRGNGFSGRIAGELDGLIAAVPSLDLTALVHRSESLELITPRAGCLFLRPDGWCGIERTRGIRAKPWLCRMFPFNRFQRLGDVVLVRPHLLCPLTAVVPPRPGEVEGSHARVRALIAEIGFETPPPELVTDAPAVLLAREAAFLDHAAAGLGRRPFAATLGCDPAGDGRDVAARVAGVLRIAEMGPAGDGPDELDAALHVLAPVLRIDLLALPPAEVSGCLHVLHRALRQLGVEVGRALPLQTRYEVAAHLLPVVRLLAGWDRLPRPEGEAGARLRADRSAGPEHVMSQLLLQKAVRRGPGGWDLLVELCAGMPRSAVVAHLRHLALQLEQAR